jgi:hypothetical protein
VEGPEFFGLCCCNKLVPMGLSGGANCFKVSVSSCFDFHWGGHAVAVGPGDRVEDCAEGGDIRVSPRL